jgi:hypothetical protein
MIVSVMKKAAACVIASGNAHAGPPLSGAARKAEVAAHCFAAVVQILAGSCLLAATQTLRDAVDSISSDKQQQQQQQQLLQASAALLAVLLARSLVVLTDAVHAAVEAAGMPPAQLIAR